MRLSKKAIEKIDTMAFRPLLQREFECSEMSVRRWLTDNKHNGPLTTAGALKVIRENTGLTDADILESSVDDQNSGIDSKDVVNAS